MRYNVYEGKMKFYYFGGHFHDNFLKQLEDCSFDGVLFTYNPLQGDFFTLAARENNKTEKIKYMLAIRAHTLSPQYLCMINHSFNSFMPNRLEINLISGHIKENEKDFGGLIGDITDLSSGEDRGKYLIKYLEELDEMSKNPKVRVPDYFVTTTNEHVFEAVSRLNNKMIIQYREYKRGHWTIHLNNEPHAGKSFDLKNKDVMISVSPIIRPTQEDIDSEFPLQQIWLPPRPGEIGGRSIMARTSQNTDGEYFTYKEFMDFINELKSKGINKVMLQATPWSENKNIMEFVKKYKEINP